MAEKSRRWSPYNYVVCNPIRMIDPDGMGWVPGTDGQPVTYDPTTGWSSNASEDTKTWGNSLMAVDNKASMDEILNDKVTKTNIIVDTGGPVGNGGELVYGTTQQGNDEPDKGVINDKDGNPVGVKEATITLYKGSIDVAIKAGSGSKYEGLSEKQAMGANATHEDIHLNKDEVKKDLQYEKAHNGEERPDKEKKATQTEQKVIDAEKKKNENAKENHQ